MSEVPVPAPTPPRRLHPLLRRLPLLVVAGIGLVFFMPQVPRDVDVDYDFGTHGLTATRLEIELHDSRGVGIRRTEMVLAPGTRRHTQHLRLARGRYRAKLTFISATGTERVERDLVVGDDDLVELHLDGSG